MSDAQFVFGVLVLHLVVCLRSLLRILLKENLNKYFLLLHAKTQYQKAVITGRD